MEALGRILIADDEGVFLDSTADLLKGEGYDCDCVADGVSAVERLRERRYDVLIADIRMPGNPNLELIQEVSSMSEGVQVILVTGYPSMESAIKSIGLPVYAYLIKPVDFSDLKASVRTAMERSKIYRAVRDTEDHLSEWQAKLRGMLQMLNHESGATSPVPVETFVNVTLQNIILGLAGLKSLTEAVARLTGDHDVCHLVDCPRLDSLSEALKDTISVLEKTKSAFKSKELGDLRRRLENLLESDHGE